MRRSRIYIFRTIAYNYDYILYNGRQNIKKNKQIAFRSKDEVEVSRLKCLVCGKDKL